MPRFCRLATGRLSSAGRNLSRVTTTTANLPLYTVDEYFALVETGQLAEDDRVELLEGVIVGKSPQTPRHASVITLVQKVLDAVFAGDLVFSQRPFIASSRSAPEPDLAVVRGGVRDYMDRHPAEALLVVEVADSSLTQDRLSKSRIYAAAGVPEYWIVNLPDEILEVYRSPDRAARLYGETQVLDRSAAVTPLHAPESQIPVADLLP